MQGPFANAYCFLTSNDSWLTIHSAELDDKVIGVIGAGSSAIQIVPQLQARRSVQLKCFVRSKTWISPPFGTQTAQRLGLDDALDCE